MTNSGESIWQAWQRVQRLYENPDTRLAIDAASFVAKRSILPENNEVGSQPSRRPNADTVIETYLRALEDLSPDLRDDFVSNLDIMGRIVNKVCTIRFVDTSDLNSGVLRYNTAEDVRVVTSGLRPSFELALVMGSELQPLLEIQVGSHEAPPAGYIGARPEDIYLFSWRSVRSVVTHG
jgi:hypothetical protein